MPVSAAYAIHSTTPQHSKCEPSHTVTLQDNVCAMPGQVALFNPKASISIQKRHPYIGNSNFISIQPGDSKHAWGQ